MAPMTDAQTLPCPAAATPPAAPTAAVERLQRLLALGGRRLLGLVGPPGAGKSTLAEALHRALPAGQSQVVPMDGYHLANVSLARLGRADRKGAPDTFDADGFVALLQRLRTPAGVETVYAPEFRREIEEPIAGAIPIEAHIPLLIVEGNYLLMNEGPWARVAGLLDEVWYVEIDDALRLQRLIRRHEQHGRSPEAARAWVAQTDEPNARRIAATQARATWTVRWDA
jgi:pantothenate kinase